MVTREVPAEKTVKVWKGDGKWCRTSAAAYYRIARAVVRKKYEKRDHDGGHFERDDQPYGTDGEFDSKKRRALIRRLARFLAFVDSRRSGEHTNLPAPSPMDAEVLL